MTNKIQISGSIVLFKEEFKELSETIDCFLKIPLSKRLFLIDNSPKRIFYDKYVHPDIEYIFVGKNVGFGAGHNIILDKIKGLSDCHLVLNPDVSFKEQVIPNLMEALNKDTDVVLVAPKVLFPNGNHQYTCRRYPKFSELLFRYVGYSSTKVLNGEYRDLDLSKPFYPNILHGCFLLLKTDCFEELKGFDERYFMYMEDVDLCRKIDAMGKKKLYYPHEVIYHVLKKRSSKNMKLFTIHLISAVRYYFKWNNINK